MKRKVLVKIHKSYRNVVAVCDSDLIGKKFEEDKFQLDLKESFYKGDEMSEEEAENIMRHMLREDATFNIVGKKSINAALKAEIISQDSVGEIKNVPFALVLG